MRVPRYFESVIQPGGASAGHALNFASVPQAKGPLGVYILSALQTEASIHLCAVLSLLAFGRNIKFVLLLWSCPDRYPA